MVGISQDIYYVGRLQKQFPVTVSAKTRMICDSPRIVNMSLRISRTGRSFIRSNEILNVLLDVLKLFKRYCRAAFCGGLMANADPASVKSEKCCG